MTTIAKAEYFPQRLQENQGNPLIEAVPPRLSPEQLIKAVARLPGFDPAQRVWQDHERELLIKRLERCVIPLSVYQDVYATIYTTLIAGYQDRNPVRPATRQWLYGVTQNVQINSKTTADSLLLTGLSGAGKSTLINSILSCFPQIIEHEIYADQPFSQQQVVFLKIEIPPDASRKALCLSFFFAIDEVLGTDYYQQYSNTRKSIDQLETAIHQICASHCVGILIIDEFQNLNVAKAGGEEVILQFFDSITNNAKIPIIKVGTPAALRLFSAKFRSGRRAGSAGFYELGQLKSDEQDWKTLVRAVWTYQWVKNPKRLDQKLESTLYELSQGIPFCLFKLMQLANLEGISSGVESISASTLRSVYTQHFGLLRHALSALRKGNPRQYEDLLPVSVWLEGGGGSVPIGHLINLAKTEEFRGDAAKMVKNHVDDAIAEAGLSASQKRQLFKIKENLETKLAEGKGAEFLGGEAE
ncbi:AAA family ATPase [uncultured Marinobacter sp.]|uniref:AAA family ATPase n=1 Tax=uncultured Marinobacter sp. TaxID=187379 RepID=UPI0026314E13|nr:AAA family ATPase [uncultured Marinobacter sp.]